MSFVCLFVCFRTPGEDGYCRFRFILGKEMETLWHYSTDCVDDLTTASCSESLDSEGRDDRSLFEGLGREWYHRHHCCNLRTWRWGSRSSMVLREKERRPHHDHLRCISQVWKYWWVVIFFVEMTSQLPLLYASVLRLRVECHYSSSGESTVNSCLLFHFLYQKWKWNVIIPPLGVGTGDGVIMVFPVVLVFQIYFISESGTILL